MALSSETSGMPLSFYQGLYLFRVSYGIETHYPFSGPSVSGIDDFKYDSPIMDFGLINYNATDNEKIETMNFILEYV